jgi:SNF2 family DNA or RNA helicase
MKLPKGFKLLAPPIGDYQVDTINYGILNQNAGLLLGLGLGKTYCAINIARYRKQKSNVNKVLVVCPPSIMYSWSDSIQKFSEYDSIVLHGNRNDRIGRFKEERDFYIINYEAMAPFIEELASLSPEMIIFDESARYIKNWNAQRTKASIYIADRALHKLILTGTLIADKPLDLWSQFRVLDGGATFGTNQYRWRSHFFNKIDKGRYNVFKVRQKYISTFNVKIYNTCVRFDIEDVLDDLPERIFKTIKLPYDDIEDIYAPVKEKVLSEINTEQGLVHLNINNILTKLIRLQQITSGFIVDNGSIQTLTRTPKLDAVIEELESIVDNKESAIVWCRFLPSIDLISGKLKQLKIKHVTMQGKDGVNKYKKWQGFQKTNIPIIVAQVTSGGIGTELFKVESKADEAQHMIFYENTWSLDVRTQAEGRNFRIGQKSICRYTDFIIDNTIDTQILGAIKGKMSVAESIMNQGIDKFLEGE